MGINGSLPQLSDLWAHQNRLIRSLDSAQDNANKDRVPSEREDAERPKKEGG